MQVYLLLHLSVGIPVQDSADMTGGTHYGCSSWFTFVPMQMRKASDMFFIVAIWKPIKIDLRLMVNYSMYLNF